MSYDMCPICGGDPYGMSSLPPCKCLSQFRQRERETELERAKRVNEIANRFGNRHERRKRERGA